MSTSDTRIRRSCYPLDQIPGAATSVSATAFIANRPFNRSMTAAASSVFYPHDVNRFLENLDFHHLAAEQAIQRSYSHTCHSSLGTGSCRRHLHRPGPPAGRLQAFAPASVEQQTGGKAGSPATWNTDIPAASPPRRTGSFRRSGAAAVDRRHGRNHRRIPKPYRLRCLSWQNRVGSSAGNLPVCITAVLHAQKDTKWPNWRHNMRLRRGNIIEIATNNDYQVKSCNAYHSAKSV